MTKLVQHFSLAVFVLLILSMGDLYAQNDGRRWGLSYTGSVFNRPVLTRNLSDHSVGRGFGDFSIMGEYYLPKKWSAEGGYFRTEVNYGGGNSRTMEGAQLGLKRYFLNRDFPIQPYAAVATQLNWGRHIEKSYIIRDNYLNSQYTRNPVVSFSPAVGADFYLFSPVAFVIRYSFNMGINSKTVIDVLQEDGFSYSLKDKGMYHNLELGIKITFPFRFSDNEQEALINVLKESLLP